MNTPENLPPNGKSSDLQEQVNSLRKLLMITLVVLLFFTAAMDLYLIRQVMNVRGALNPQVAAIDQYTRKELPNIQAFISNLQTFAKTHPDINPILAKYDLVPKTNSMFSPSTPKTK